MKLQNSTVIETDSRRFVEMTFADQPELDQTTEFLTFRIAVEQEGYPRIPKAQLEALLRARNAIGDEIHRLEQIRGRVHPNEDWRPSS